MSIQPVVTGGGKGPEDSDVVHEAGRLVRTERDLDNEDVCHCSGVCDPADTEPDERDVVKRG